MKKLRIERNMTQQDIAKSLSNLKSERNKMMKSNNIIDEPQITRATISKYETGKLGMSLTTLLDLTNILEIPLSILIGQDYKSHEIYKDEHGYSIKILNFENSNFNELDNDIKNKIIDDAIYELSKIKKEMNNK